MKKVERRYVTYNKQACGEKTFTEEVGSGEDGVCKGDCEKGCCKGAADKQIGEYF